MSEPDIHKAEATDPNTRDTRSGFFYHVALPVGTEGPYSLAELRELLITGRVKPDDRVMRDGVRAAVSMKALIPEAPELARQAEQNIRRRRTTSGEHEARRSDSSSQVRRFRTPLPFTAPETPESLNPSAPATPGPPTAQPPHHTIPPALRAVRKIVLLVGLTLAIAANLVILRLDRDEMIQPRAPFLTRAELEREPELARFDRIGADLAESIRCSGIMGRAAWDALPPRRGAVFVIHAYEPALHRGVDGFRQMPEISADAPLLEDLAKAYRTIGAGDLAGLLDAAANHQTVDQDAAVWMTAHCAELAAIKAAFVTGNLNDLLP